MHKANRIVFLLTMVFILSGCFNLGSNTTATSSDPRFKTYDNADLSISIPKDWEIVPKSDFTSEVPDVTQVVFRNNVKNETFTANIVVLKNLIQDPVSSLDYSKMVFNRQKSGLIDFIQVKKEDINISISGKDTPTSFLVFQAKKSSNDQSVKYLQTYAVKNNAAFIVTGAVSTKENDVTVQTIESVIKSLQIK